MKKTSTPERQPANFDARRRCLRLAAAGGVAGLANVLGACGGGQAEDPATGEAGGLMHPLGIETGGTGIAYFSAALDAIGPVRVGDVSFDTSECTFTNADGMPLDEGSLRPGMTAQIVSSGVYLTDTQRMARAMTLRIGEQLLGPVAALQSSVSGGGSFSALGQTVVVSAATLFDAALAGGWGGLHVGSVLRVWGQLDTIGARIVATRIDAAGSEATQIVRGVLTALNRSAGTLRIGGLDFRLPSPDAASGLHVGDVVRALLPPFAPGAVPTLIAVRADGLQPPQGSEAEIEGRVTRYASRADFAVDGVAVDGSAVVLAVGSPSLALGVGVEVHGRMIGPMLVASQIQVQAEESAEMYELEGTISANDASAHSFVLRGIVVNWSAATRFIGGSAALLRAQRPVNVKGRLSPDRKTLQASIIHVEGG